MPRLKGLRKFGLGLLLLILGAFGFLGGRAVADQPHMRVALDHLRAARGQLEVAASDKRGHRVRALRLVTDAIRQVEMGVEYDRTH